MDPNIVNQTTPIPTKKSILNYLLFLFAIILFFVGMGVGYFVKGSSNSSVKSYNATNSSPTPTIKVTQPIVRPSIKPNYVPPFDDSKADLVTYTSTAIPGNALKPYSISYPFTWTRDVKRTGEIMDDFTLTNGGYSIGISQGPGGGAGCIFEGEVPNGPFNDYRNKKYIDFQSGIGTLRRFEDTPVGNPNTLFYFCSKATDGSYFYGSNIGGIGYEVPKNYDPAILLKMDEIVKSLKALK